MAEHEHVEVGAELKLDDHTSEAAHKIHEAFESIDEKVTEVTHELAGFAKQALAVAAGFELSHGIESVKEFGHEIFAAAQAKGADIKALAGVLAMSDRTGAGFDELRGQASELHEELETIGIKSGVASGSLIEMYESIATRSSKSREEVLKLTEEIAMAGRVLPGGADEIANAYRDLESGIVRPKNAIVQLIRMTGTAQGTARDIAKGLNEAMQAGRSEEAFKLADAAIARMSDKAKSMPLGFGAVVQSLKDIREQLFAAIGEPMVKALLAPLTRLRTALVENKEKVAEYAHMLGEKIGEWVNEAADKVQEGFEYLKNHAEEIKAAIKDGVKMSKEVLDFIIDHKEEIAIAFGARMAIPAVGGAVSGVKGALEFGGAIAGGGGLAASTAGLMYFAAAVLAAGAALYELHKVSQETHSTMKESAMSALRAGFGGGILQFGGELRGRGEERASITAREERMEKIAKSAVLTPELRAEFEHLRRLNMESARAIGDDAVAVGNHAQDMLNHTAAMHASTDAMVQAASQANIEPIVNAWKAAHEAHNTQIEQFAESIILGSSKLQSAFVEAGYDLKQGFEDLTGKIVFGPPRAPGGVKPDGVNMHFPGATFNVKQDFRDQDPDRVALVFRRDLGSSALARVGARTGGIGGPAGA